MRVFNLFHRKTIAQYLNTISTYSTTTYHNTSTHFSRGTSQFAWRNFGLITNISQKHENQLKLSELPKHKQTICALASGSGACGVAVIRVSGPNAMELSSLLMHNKPLKPRYATFTRIFHPVHKGLVDTGLVLWFPAPNSFTGEDVLELQVHGSPAIVKCLLNGIVQTDLARIAEAGEFTRRAFYNNKMDLAEVEGLRDLLSAETDAQRKQALAMSRGVQSKKINEWISRLSDCTSLIDGHIEFGDTDDVTIDLTSIDDTLADIQSELQDAIKRSAKGFTIKNGINIALYGMTNVGKSSLLNALTAEDRAIVSDMPNTTRDLIQARLDVNGYAVNLIDTAGFYNDPTHRIETDAMQKSIEILFDPNTALHVLVVGADIYLKYAKHYDKTDMLERRMSPSCAVIKNYVEDMFVSDLIRDKEEFIDSVAQLFLKNTLVIVTKLDLIKADDFPHFEQLLQAKNVLGTSVVRHIGIDKVFDCFSRQILEIYNDFSPDDVQFNTIRMLAAVKMAEQHIADALLIGEGAIDMKSLFMRAGITQLAGILGKTCSSDMLDDIFDNFCIGK